MQNKITKFATIIILLMTFSPQAFAQKLLFVSDECIHCNSLRAELEAHNLYAKYEIEEHEIFYNKENALLYLEKSKEVGYKAGGVPLLIDGDTYIEGKDSILEYLSNNIETVSILSEEDSRTLNNMLKTAIISSPDTSDTKRLIGIFVIIFGVSLFIKMIHRALKKVKK